MKLENFTNGYDVTKGSTLAAGEKNEKRFFFRIFTG